MDAANKYSFTKIALFLTIALLVAAPFAAQAQTAFSFPSGNSVSITGTSFGFVQVNADTGVITYKVTQVPAAGDPSLVFSQGGIQNAPSGSGGFQTGQQLAIAVGSIPGNVTSGAHTITLNLQSTAPNTSINGQITVTWNATGSSGGGGGTSSGSGLTITYPSGSSVQMSSSGGATATGSFTLTNTTSGSINYVFSAPAYNSGNGWLSYQLLSSAGQIAAGQQVIFTLVGNPAGQANGTLSATFNITYSGGGSGSINQIPVTFVVSNNSSGGGGGTSGTGTVTDGPLSASPGTVSWSYSTGSGLPAPQTVTVQNTSVGIYNVSVQIANNGQYLVNVAANGSGQQTSLQGVPIASALSLYLTSNVQSLPAGTYQEQINISDPFSDAVIVTATITVNGGSGGSGGSTISISPNIVQLSAAVGQTTLAQATVNVTSSVSGTVNLAVSGTGLTLQNNSTTQQIVVTANQSSSFTVYGNPTSLALNVYIGSITATEGSLSTTAAVDFVVGNGSSGGSSSTSVGPTSLQFSYQIGGTTSANGPQQVTIVPSGAYTVSSITPANSWLTVTPTSGTAPGSVFVSVNPNGLAAGSYSGSFVVTPSTGVGQTVNVSLLVSSSTVIFPVNQSTTLTYTAGGSNPTGSFLVLSSNNTSVAITNATSSQSWLTIQQQNSSTPASFGLSINGSALSNGLNFATVTITSNAADANLVVPVIVTASGNAGGSGTLSLSPSSLSLTSSQNTGFFSFSPTTTSTFSATANATWLSVSPSSGTVIGGQSQQFTVTANTTGLTSSSYSSSITFSANGVQQTVPVTLTLSNGSGGGSGNITLSPTSMSFSYMTGQNAPAAQGFNVTSNSGGSISYTVTTSTASGGNWLQTNITSGVTGQAVNVMLNSSVLAGLPAGTYTGTVTVTPTGGTAQSVAVTLTVQGLPTVSASPTNITLSYTAGNTNAPSATIQVSGTAASLPFTVNASSSGWLQVTPTSGDTGTNGATLQVSVNPSGLNAGSYTGTIVVSGTGSASGSSTITVTLNVTAPLPTISAVVNAASGASGAVSPGEIVSIFGTAMGPGTAATLTLSNGKVSTTLGGVQVVFNGIPAPLTYVSATQINAVVPYELSPLSFAPYVQVKYLNQSSNAFTVSVVSTAPGIFTQNGSGTGPGAILNQDNSTNGTSSVTKPAAKGSVVVIYMTGEGQTSPGGVTGGVTCSTCTVAQLPVPLLPVTVTFIDPNTNTRYPANFLYAGEAPGFVSGLMQVDAVVPTNVPSGTLQVVVTVGGTASQNGVTVAIQ